MSDDESRPLIPASIPRWRHRPQKHCSTKSIGHRHKLRIKPEVKPSPRRIVSYRVPPPAPPITSVALLSPRDERLPKRSAWQLLANGGIDFGVEFLYALEMAFVTPILLQLGVPEKYYSFIWFISPALGLLLQPVIGAWSDRCTARWGRRRPFILALSVGMLVGLALMFNGKDVATAIIVDRNTAILVATVLTIIGNVLMDFCTDSIDTPATAYLMDTCRPDDQERGMNLHALMAGLGGGMGYVFAGVDWDQTILATWVGSDQRILFTFGAVWFVLSAAATLFSIKEIPLDKPVKTVPSDHYSNGPPSPDSDIASLSTLTPRKTTSKSDYDAAHSINHIAETEELPTFYVSNEEIASGNFEDDSVPGLKQFETQTHKEQPHMIASIFWPLARARSISDNEIANVPKYVEEEKYFTDGNISEDEAGENSQCGEQINTLSHPNYLDLTDDDLRRRGVSNNEEASALMRSNSMKPEVSRNSSCSVENANDNTMTLRMLYMAVIRMPNVLKRLCFCHFLGNLAMEALLGFFTDFVGQVVFHGSPNAEPGTTAYVNYNNGVKMGCWGLFIYAFSSAVYSALLDVIVEYVSIRTAYFFGYLMFSIGAAMCVMFPNTYAVLSLCVAFGIMFATISTLPYNILAEFHQNVEFVQDSPGNSKRGSGMDTSILNAQTFLGQIVNAACLGPLISITGTVKAVLLFCSVVGFVGCFWIALFVVYELPGNDEEKRDFCDAVYVDSPQQLTYA